MYSSFFSSLNSSNSSRDSCYFYYASGGFILLDCNWLCSLRSWRYCKRTRNKVLAAKPRGEWGVGLLKYHNRFVRKRRRNSFGGLRTEILRLRPRLYGEKLSRVEGSPALPSQLLTTVYMSKVVPVDRVKVNPTKLFIGPA